MRSPHFRSIFLSLILSLSFAHAQEERDTVLIGGGVFWSLEAIFDQLQGVVNASNGYSGGEENHPDFRIVEQGNTGHSQVVEVVYDPNVLPFKQLILVFLNSHDPTSLYRQGNDIGKQYKSVIFYTTENQRNEASEIINILSNSQQFSKPIKTLLLPKNTFFYADAFHQNYYMRNRSLPYCSLVIAPKVEKIKTLFPALMKGS